MSLRGCRMTRRNAWPSSASTGASFYPLSSFYSFVLLFICPSITATFQESVLLSCVLLVQWRAHYLVLRAVLFQHGCIFLVTRPSSHASFYYCVFLVPSRVRIQCRAYYRDLRVALYQHGHRVTSLIRNSTPP